MARVKISEYKAKSIVLPLLGIPYNGLHIDTAKSDWLKSLKKLSSALTYVVKVDQGVKKRGKSGLMVLHIALDKVADAVCALEKKGYTSFIVEPFSAHNQKEERYLALQRTREGIKLWYHTQGGIDIEDAMRTQNIQEHIIEKDKLKATAQQISMPFDILNTLIDVFEKEYFAFLEINPFILGKEARKEFMLVLDLAVEVDSAGEYFAPSWSKKDFVQKSSTLEEEMKVKELSEKSPSSFKLEVLNKDGAVWMLLSGGGASLVIADEYYNLGKGKLIGNYGEYSGAPNEDETYEYAKNIVALLIKSKARRKVLLVAGGVANFTDVSVTFKGIVRTLEESIEALRLADVAVYVRRGGPKQEKGLALMKKYIDTHGLKGYVTGPACSLNDIVTKSLMSLT